MSIELDYCYSTDKDIRKFAHDTGEFWCVIIIMFMVVSRDGTFYRLLCEPSQNFTKILSVTFFPGVRPRLLLLTSYNLQQAYAVAEHTAALLINLSVDIAYKQKTKNNRSKLVN